MLRERSVTTNENRYQQTEATDEYKGTDSYTGYYDLIIKWFLNADVFASTGQGFLGYNMFAYCENEPIMSEDPSGEICMSNIPMTDGSHDGHYHDPASTIWNPINGQGNYDIRFGYNDLSAVGCGAIAVFNAMCLLGYSLSLRSVLDYFSSPLTWRPLGVWPNEIKSYLDYMGVSYTGSFDPSIIENVKNGGVVVVTFWNETVSGFAATSGSMGSVLEFTFPWIPTGAHTVAITFLDGLFYVYNANNLLSYTATFDNIFSYIGEGFIYGIYCK